MKKQIQKLLSLTVISGLLTLFFGFGSIVASPTTQFGQTINSGTLATDMRDASRVTIASPSITMSAAAFSFDCQTGGSASTGTFGSNSQRIYVDNPSAANNGWTLTLAATSGATTTWTDGSKILDFNDPTGSTAGCDDGVDTDTAKGQMTVDASVATLTADCTTCSTANITKGSSTAFSEGVTNTITLLNAAAASDNVGRWYLTGVSISQTIPAEQEAGNYTINMTLTATAS